MQKDDVDVYTYVKLVDGRWKWHQEVFDKILPDTRGSAPKNASPWLVLPLTPAMERTMAAAELKSTWVTLSP